MRRRKFLAALSAVKIGILAGCSIPSGGGEEEENGDGEDGEEGGSGEGEDEKERIKR